MNPNRKIIQRKKRVKNEALELRENLEKNPQYNIFVGDKRYQTNFWLQFQNSSSEFKYRKVIRNR